MTKYVSGIDMRYFISYNEVIKFCLTEYRKKEVECEMNADDNMQNRINELIAELSDCREDERNVQNQILEVLSVAGTILGILFGASYFGSNLPDFTIKDENIKSAYISNIIDIINRNVTYQRIMFLLSMLIFCTAFAYIIVLGISNILRYYYIQTLEDRLHVLIPSEKDDYGRGCFLHWNAYSAPVMTKNIKHITSSYTVLNYICYAVAIMCIVLFSIGLVTSLFLQIENIKWLDIVVIIVAVIFMILALVLFIYVSVSAKNIDQFSWDTAHDNHNVRMKKAEGVIYKRAKAFRRILCYLIYPKIQDLQKPVLIIGGFVCGGFLFNIEWGNYLKYLVLVMVIFDFMAYQARYQINDIRGLEEDQEAGARNRLISDDIDNPGYIIRLSLGAAIVKIIIALVMTIMLGREVKALLLISLFILFVSTTAYEIARKKQCTNWIFFWVGAGYPLRFFVGFFLVVPKKLEILLHPQILCTLLALWAYGTCSSILSWCNQVNGRMQKVKKSEGKFPDSYKKQHFKDLQEILRKRYEEAEKFPINENIMPLREKGKFFDPWNIAFLCSLCFLCLVACFGRVSWDLLCLEIVICIMFAVNGFFYRGKKLIFMGIGGGCMIAKIVVMRLSGKFMMWYLLLSVVQIIIAITYYVLCYQPQLKKRSFKEIFYGGLVKIVGEYAADVMGMKSRN